MAVKVSKSQICTGTISKFNATRSTICVESFIRTCIKSTHKASFLALCYSTIKVSDLFENAMGELRGLLVKLVDKLVLHHQDRDTLIEQSNIVKISVLAAASHSNTF